MRGKVAREIRKEASKCVTNHSVMKSTKRGTHYHPQGTYRRIVQDLKKVYYGQEDY